MDDDTKQRLDDELDHGMHGTSETHCCYKHESKDFYRPWITVHLKGEFEDNLPFTFNNSFRAMDRCEALNELLAERGEPDAYETLGLLE